jgi:hypothetical protein
MKSLFILEGFFRLIQQLKEEGKIVVEGKTPASFLLYCNNRMRRDFFGYIDKEKLSATHSENKP